ncbi:mucin-3A-like isoform X3 [Trachinotus anak]|uniref:mucin-3A-like isoform X3 n=1 Tax=Trachinotus anak TaxID=443729 RepID=UPI0039F17A2F
MAGCLFVILMCSLHLIQVQGQKPQLSLQHLHGDLVMFMCSLHGSADNVTSCNLYFGKRSRPVLTTTVWKKTSAKRWFCRFSVKIDDFLRHLHFVQQKDASCDYNLGSEHNSLSPRSNGYMLTDIVERESPAKPAFTMTTGLTVSSPRASTPVTPVKAASDIVKKESRTTPTMSTLTTITGLTVSSPRASTPVTPVKAASGTYIVKIESSTTPTMSTFTTIAGLSVSSPHASTPVTPVKAASDIVEKASTYTMTTGLTVRRTHASTPVTPIKGLTVARPRITKGRFISTSPTSAKPPSGMRIWNCVVVVTGFGVTVGIISLGLALLCTKSDRCSCKRAQASVTGDVVDLRNLGHRKLLPAGNDEAYSVVTSVPAADSPTGSGKDSREPQNEDSDLYHVYATIAEEPAASAVKETVYSTLQTH